MPIIPALRRLRQEDHEFQASLRCVVNPVRSVRAGTIVILLLVYPQHLYLFIDICQMNK
jgi:hypothetical protein